MPGFETGNAYGLAAMTAVYSFSGLVNRILDIAHMRYYGSAFP